jgi:hypothetical protein
VTTVPTCHDYDSRTLAGGRANSVECVSRDFNRMNDLSQCPALLGLVGVVPGANGDDVRVACRLCYWLLISPRTKLPPLVGSAIEGLRHSLWRHSRSRDPGSVLSTKGSPTLIGPATPGLFCASLAAAGEARAEGVF